MWKNIVEPDRPEVRIWPMRFACWVTRAANTVRTDLCVILIALTQQQCLNERVSVLRLYIACFILFIFFHCRFNSSSLYFTLHIIPLIPFFELCSFGFHFSPLLMPRNKFIFSSTLPLVIISSIPLTHRFFLQCHLVSQ